MNLISCIRKHLSYPLLSGQSVGRILRRTLILLLALMLVILAAFYATLRTLNRRNYLQEQYRQSLSLLQQTDRALQISLNHLETESLSFLSDSATTSVMVRQGQTDFDQLYQVSSSLSGLLRESTLIRSAWLELLDTGSVFCSDQQILPEQDCGAELQSLLHSGQAGLFQNGEDLYYALEYPAQNPLGILLLQLDTSALYRSTFNSTRSVYIYDSGMTPLFSGLCRYPEDAAIQETLYEDESSAFYRAGNGLGRYYTLYRSSTTGLNYLSIQESLSFIPVQRDTVLLLIPCGLLLLAGTLLFSLYSLHSVYRPIQRSLDALVGSAPAEMPDVPSGLSETLSAVAPDVFLHLFRRILYEGMSDPAELDRALEGLPCFFPPEKSYAVLRLETLCEDGKRSTELYRRLYTLHTRELAGHYWRGKCPMLADDSGRGYLLLFLSCGSLDASQLSGLITDFHEYLRRESRDLPYEPLMGCSGLYTGFLQLPAAFGAASQDLACRRYYSAAPAPAVPDPVAERFQQKTQHILQQALHREKNIAGALASELCSEPVPPDQQTAVLNAVQSTVVRQLLDCSLDPAGFEFLHPQGNPHTGSAPLFRERLRQLLAGAIESLYRHGQSSRNQYLADAKEYIAQHYDDSTLSLDAVSRHAGVSSPYLSSIFSELQGQRFLDYLNRFRVEKAVELLRSTDLSVSEIGFRTGFYSVNTFIRTFKKITGETPGAYRTRRSGEKL